MEDDQLGEESKASREEIVRSDGVDDDFGHGQSYECVFCKRGFSTAQALGGHMNIHRRDRARMRQPRTVTNPSRAIEEDQPITRAHHEVFPYPNCIFPNSLDSSRNHHHTHQLVTPNSVHITRESHTSNPLDMLNSQCLDYYRDDHLCLRLGNQASYDHTRLWIGDQQRNRQDEEDGDELDLELRLGHYPWV